MRVILASVVLGLVAVVVGATAAPQLAARGVTVARAAGDCHAVKFIAVRGSGDTLNDFGVIGTKISSALARKARSANVDYRAYGLDYPAVGIDWWSLTGTGAAIKLVSYNLSRRKGRDNLRAFIKQEVSECPDEKLVLEGYSQGAHVVGDVLSKKVGGLTAKELSHIKAVVLIADPRFNSQEKFVQGFSSFRIGRNGILGARSPGDLSSVAGKIRGWCRKDDLVCQGPGTTGNHAQAKYWSDYGEDVVDYLASKLEWESPTISTQVPPPPPSGGSAGGIKPNGLPAITSSLHGVSVSTTSLGDTLTCHAPTFAANAPYYVTYSWYRSVYSGQWTGSYTVLHSFSPTHVVTTADYPARFPGTGRVALWCVVTGSLRDQSQRTWTHSEFPVFLTG